MQSLIKKIAAVIIAVATMLGFAGLGATTALAADPTGTITVNTVKGFTGDLTYYQMFSAEVSTEADKAVTYTLKDEWKTFFTSSDDAAAGTRFAADNNLSKNATDYIMNLPEAQRADFANKAAAWAAVTTNGITGTSAPKGTNATDPIVINGLAFGYYLIVPADGQTNNELNRQQSLLVSVTESEANVSVSLKYETPSIEKKVQEKDSTDAPVKGTDVNVGDTVTYTLNTKIPNTEGYKTYVFNIHDTLSKGLTLASKADGKFTPTITIKKDGLSFNPTIDADYTTDLTENNDGTTTVAIKFTDITKYRAYNNNGTIVDLTGAEITVTYDATLNADAVAGTDPNTNKATVEYTNDPYTGGTGTSVPSEADVYDFQFTLDKYLLKDGENYGQDSTHLSGAEFKVFPNKTENNIDKPDTTAMKFTVTEGSGSAATVAAYDSKSTATDLEDTLTSPASGKILVKGLAAGTYWVQETKAPTGYNKLENYIKVTIKPTYDSASGKITKLETTYGEYTADGQQANTGLIKDVTADSGNPILPVGNKKGSVLPSTGGMGTILFTVFGVLIVALGTAWYVKSNRKTAK